MLKPKQELANMAKLLLGDFELVDCLSVECQCNIKGKETSLFSTGLFQGISGFHKQNSSHDKKQTEIS